MMYMRTATVKRWLLQEIATGFNPWTLFEIVLAGGRSFD
jgi:hypothetical protein